MTALMLRVVEWMIEERNLTVYVEPSVLEDDKLKSLVENSGNQAILTLLHPWIQGRDIIDFIVTLGGDGTVLYAS